MKSSIGKRLAAVALVIALHVQFAPAMSAQRRDFDGLPTLPKRILKLIKQIGVILVPGVTEETPAPPKP